MILMVCEFSKPRISDRVKEKVLLVELLKI